MYPRLCKPGTNLPRIPPPFISHPGNENLQLELPIESHSPLCQVYRRFPCTKHLATILSKTQVAVERTRGCSPSMTNFPLTIFLNDFLKKKCFIHDTGLGGVAYGPGPPWQQDSPTWAPTTCALPSLPWPPPLPTGP